MCFMLKELDRFTSTVLLEHKSLLLQSNFTVVGLFTVYFLYWLDEK